MYTTGLEPEFKVIDALTEPMWTELLPVSFIEYILKEKSVHLMWTLVIIASPSAMSNRVEVSRQMKQGNRSTLHVVVTFKILMTLKK